MKFGCVSTLLPYNGPSIDLLDKGSETKGFAARRFKRRLEENSVPVFESKPPGSCGSSSKFLFDSGKEKLFSRVWDEICMVLLGVD